MREAGTPSATNAELTSMFQPLLYQCVDLNHRASGAIREMQIETTMRDLCIPDRMAILKTRQNKRQQVLARLWRTAAFVHCCWECKMVQPLWKTVWRLLKKLKLKLSTTQVELVVKNLPANVGDLKDTGSIPGSGRSPGGGHGNPLKYSCLENPMDRGAWRATVRKVTKSRARTEVT